MDKIKQTLVDAALACAQNLRATADRLERAAHARDWSRLAEVALSTHTQSVDWIRGVATAVSRVER